MHIVERHVIVRWDMFSIAAFPVIEHRRELIRRTRGVTLGLSEVLEFWRWRQSQGEPGCAPWLDPFGRKIPSNDEVLMWWDRYVAHLQAQYQEWLDTPSEHRVGQDWVAYWTPEECAKCLDAYKFDPLPPEPPRENQTHMDRSGQSPSGQ